MAYTEAGKFNTRIALKHDIEANWIKAKNFIPLEGEIIIYDADENYSYQRIKIGDGITKVNVLPFDNIQGDWNQNDETFPDYIKNRTHYIKSSTINKVYFNNVTVQGTNHGSYYSYVINDTPHEFCVELVETVEFTLVVNNELTYTDTLHRSPYGFLYIGNHDPQEDGFEYRATLDGMDFVIDLPISVPQTSTFTLSAIINKETVVTLDEKFIPDTIARKSDVETAINSLVDLEPIDLLAKLNIRGQSVHDYPLTDLEFITLFQNKIQNYTQEELFNLFDYFYNKYKNLKIMPVFKIVPGEQFNSSRYTRLCSTLRVELDSIRPENESTIDPEFDLKYYIDLSNNAVLKINFNYILNEGTTSEIPWNNLNSSNGIMTITFELLPKSYWQ